MEFFLMYFNIYFNSKKEFYKLLNFKNFIYIILKKRKIQLWIKYSLKCIMKINEKEKLKIIKKNEKSNFFFKKDENYKIKISNN